MQMGPDIQMSFYRCKRALLLDTDPSKESHLRFYTVVCENDITVPTNTATPIPTAVSVRIIAIYRCCILWFSPTSCIMNRKVRLLVCVCVCVNVCVCVH